MARIFWNNLGKWNKPLFSKVDWFLSNIPAQNLTQTFLGAPLPSFLKTLF